MIEIKNLNVFYSNLHILKDVSFKFNEKWLTIVGESGSGKTTILKSILNILPQNARKSGEVLIDGKEVSAPEWGKITIVFQDAMSIFNPLMKIIDEFYETYGGDKIEKIKNLLQMLKLEERVLYSYPHQLSGGQKQRIAVIMATINEPDYILLDEPTSSVDVVTEEIILDFINNLKSHVLLVTHNLRIAKKYSQKIIVLKNGVIVEENTPENIFTCPKNEYTKILVESI